MLDLLAADPVMVVLPREDREVLKTNEADPRQACHGAQLRIGRMICSSLRKGAMTESLGWAVMGRAAKSVEKS